MLRHDLLSAFAHYRKIMPDAMTQHARFDLHIAAERGHRSLVARQCQRAWRGKVTPLYYLFVLLLAAPQGPVVEATAPEIEVIGKRLAKIRLDISRDGVEVTGCRVAVTSGDKLVDDQACPAAKVCFRKGNMDYAALLSCIDHRIALTISQLDAALRKR